MAENVKVIARNRKASHEYHLLDRYEAGLELMGSEIKSIRAGRISLQEAFVTEQQGELWVLNMHITEFKEAAREGHAPRRPRKLLLHRKEINTIIADMTRKGYTVVPTQLHLRHGLAKLEIAVARGKKQYDKREALRERDDKRRTERALREYR
ncbi:MAG: SsrA-binding protein SmpB [Chloroflexi bacterium]|nr:SsrA-binding protein SmpB [Chloroflexota bacterium]